ncbi:hypothetical protein ACJMK2_016911 [Sinanodonta woodiana]|uniref:Uncharacterized protein n=1 Tax=Sinanodonta woodiana TaxID=1069815 RepID=A0ABD3UYC8_SINWO
MECMKTLNTLSVLICLMTGYSTLVLGTSVESCVTKDCVIYDLSSQTVCTEVSEEPATYDCRWASGLNINVDEVILKGRIVAYKIKWFGGYWSGWFVTGINDIDIKYNTAERRCSIPCKANTMRRMWSYFYDHIHSYIFCKNP